MRRTVRLDAAKAPPDRAEVLRGQGIPADAEVSERVSGIVEQALGLYGKLAEPSGIYAEVSPSEFAAIYEGEGLNEHPAPVEGIFPRADHLALFAVTLGEALSREIRDLFRENEPALGYMLDAVASERADTAAELAGREFLASLLEEGRTGASTRALAYSPGYCGWHITGQRRLFDYLRPEEIGITLNDSCLMQPLKSVSGVFVAGPGEIHEFDDDFDFCDHCVTHQCRERIALVVGEETGRAPEGELG